MTTAAASKELPKGLRYSPSHDSRDAEQPAAAHWSLATRVAFRFCFIYFGLYVILTQMLQGMLVIPGLELPDLGRKTPFLQITIWFGRHLLGIANPYDPRISGSGDRTYDWVQSYTLLTVALFGTAIWSYVAQQRTNHDRLYRWFRLFLRIALGTTFLSYGFAKVVPLQMSNQLMRLVEPYGNFSMMGVLWASIGSSPAYEAFTGLAEIGAGTLLLIPGTARAGAFVALMDATAVFMLNMTYDVPVKLFSFHLVLMSAVLIAPVAPAMFDLFIRNREGRIPPEPGLGRRVRGAQIAFTFYVLTLSTAGDYRALHQFGSRSTRSPLYGIWDVRTMTIAGVDHPALLTDRARVRRLVFDAPQMAIAQMMNDQFRYLGSSVDTVAHTVTFDNGGGAAAKSTLTYRRPDRAHLLLDGTLDGQPTHLELLYRNPTTFVQRSHGFNWVQEFPYNR